jgi:hypothetical protein
MSAANGSSITQVPASVVMTATGLLINWSLMIVGAMRDN